MQSRTRQTITLYSNPIFDIRQHRHVEAITDAIMDHAILAE